MASPRPSAVAAALAMTLLAGCDLAPPHVTPPLPTPAVYPAEVSPGGDHDVVSLSWQDVFADPQLRQVIAMALDDNRDLRVSVARIEEARGQYRIQRSDLFPKLAGSAAYTRERVGSAAIPPEELPAGTTGLPSGFTYNDYSLGVGVSAYELDFWGRVRNLTAAARARYLGTLAAERSFRLSLIRDVATTYITARSLQEQAEQAQQTLAAREQGLHIAKLRLDAGVTSALDYRQSEALLTQAQTELAALHNQIAQQHDALQLLVGAPIDPARLATPRSLAGQGVVHDIDAGLPSALLADRPDIIQAEENLRAARADVGAARAAFFPQITLTGQYGYASTSLDSLIGPKGQSWSIGPSLNVPIFNWGELRGDLSVAKARQVEQVATYEKTVQTAFREVSDALADRRYLAEQIVAQSRAVDADSAQSALAKSRYLNGVAEYLDVLDADRNLFSAEQALIQLRGRELNSLVTLYAALGGGLGPPPKPRAGDAAPTIGPQPIKVVRTKSTSVSQF